MAGANGTFINAPTIGNRISEKLLLTKKLLKSRL